MKKTMTMAVSTVALSLIANQSFAAGWHLSEYSTTSMGRSFAGQGVVADDYSALAFNPAGMQYNDKSGFQAGASVVSLHFDYKGSIETQGSVDANGMPRLGNRSGSGHTRPTRVLGHVFAQQKINDKATLGLGVYVPYGLATDYKNDWFAQSHAGISQLSAINVSPALSYQVTDMVALGAALNIQYITARLGGSIESNGLYFDTGANDLRGDDYGVGYTLGATITPRKDIRLGVAFRSKVSHELEGDLKISGMPAQTYVPGRGFIPTGSMNGKQDIKAKVITPEVLVLSGAYDLNKCFTLSGTAKWTRWSRFKNLDIIRKADGSAISQTHENWKNTWFYSLGLDYRYNKNWAFRTGVAYDETVIKSAEYRTARIPDGRRILTSLGASYKINNWQFDAGYTHIFVHGGTAHGEANGESETNLKYSADADMFSLGFQYKF